MAGSIAEVVAAAREAARERDVYIDGGALTLIPVILGAGQPLFAGVEHRKALELVEHRMFAGGLVQLRYRLGA